MLHLSSFLVHVHPISVSTCDLRLSLSLSFPQLSFDERESLFLSQQQKPGIKGEFVQESDDEENKTAKVVNIEKGIVTKAIETTREEIGMTIIGS
jgi:hypothetical protein